MRFKAVLLDLGGVLYVGDEVLPGAVEAVARLRASGLKLRFLTNTTRMAERAFKAKLTGMGVDVGAGELFMPALAARQVLEAQGLTPKLLVHPALVEDFEGLPSGGPDAVVVGDAGEAFTYAALNPIFRALAAGAPFLALAKNRTFRDADGQLSLDAGPFVAALEYAVGREATVLGKPSPDFYGAAVASCGCAAGEAVMVGDDAEADVAGARACGIAGVLVRTGKYQPGAEATVTPKPSAVVDDLAAAAEWILGQT